ncbi:unnamed protein product [Zymoseptoria tritici ST99CH_3D1]|uniref:Uncharacterized protein n=2 Tax=Zymoseptoria tritici TaxID=1047171 RepID=F9XP83_ZYMTI|nr:uncharacterized protein MYCGRDRAFT_97210 [Zymoseptoria tritici IPO323]EGP83039.1 hypothetical protein MYCGRDRAFT_97210 [Zymoseptoria tritici IPO323]SMQ55939.1 unnamed protein product [Zymoseptoria tritici ST99CH_3D7]SMR64276.1 unnamed protein product [Zymoseptoria tritici ST99CH_3D1]
MPGGGRFKLGPGAIAGIVIVVLFLFLLCIVVACCCSSRGRFRRSGRRHFQNKPHHLPPPAQMQSRHDHHRRSRSTRPRIETSRAVPDMPHIDSPSIAESPRDHHHRDAPYRSDSHASRGARVGNTYESDVSVVVPSRENTTRPQAAVVRNAPPPPVYGDVGTYRSSKGVARSVKGKYVPRRSRTTRD